MFRCYVVTVIALFPGLRSAFHRLQYRKAGSRGPGTFSHVSDVTDREIIRMWATCKPPKTSPARMHWSTTILSRKMAAHEGAFTSLFTRQLGGQRVLPSQDSEDAQQQSSRARPHSINGFLLPFYPWRHSHEEMYQGLSRFIVLQVTGSWVGVWEWGYVTPSQMFSVILQCIRFIGLLRKWLQNSETLMHA